MWRTAKDRTAVRAIREVVVMSNTREYVGCKSIEIENYDGNGNNLYNMWLQDECDA